MSYTDVDRLILDRWTEVVALREAFDKLLARMKDTVEGAVGKAKRWADEHGFRTEYDLKVPSFDVWRPTWQNRKGDPALYLRIAEFAPYHYGSVREDHPWLWLFTSGMGRLRINEIGRVQFARDLKGELGSAAAKWEHHEAVQAEEPFGRYCTEVTDSDRVRWMSNPEELTQFIVRGIEELMELAPAIDSVLTRLTPK